MVIFVSHQGSWIPHGPSWTFMDPQVDPKIDIARLILKDPCRLKAPQGPSKVQIDDFLFIDLKTTDKLKNAAWFEVNPTIGSSWS